ncbi:MAG: glutamine--fructose-6-phosphate transaminase (isomerizing) [Chloroflexi bacterium]|nr:glutamine--fructose-6-phosphate transaminase (isomerizing) [Chloroflexota bacterium]MBT4514729.1 glutamine--fructose-6-phosphate transaminase (isomerizing) [Chloroflexota bacterium]MBT5319967.1 glutamine--fructose-6-phosphate transaminase (isomerizing) [Chloroflexota bacterium]MBT6682186.1 glutamine--fructose-6-phosphate transaminase (isomerizing) [Chloroflexota bacterium]
MCGIIAYAGPESAVPILVSGLRTLEYRGYDSAGIGVQNGSSKISVTRALGVDQLAEAVSQNGSGCVSVPNVGIAHTRWATHGGVTVPNAHPHTSADGRVAIVHNGIVENYMELRAELSDAGIEFTSETDSEVIAHLVARCIDSGDSLAAAVRCTAQRIRGASSFVATSADEPGVIVGVRLGNAGGIVVGVGDGFNLLASDVLAILPHTDGIIYLQSGEVATIQPSGAEISDLSGETLDRPVVKTGRSFEAAAKGEHRHFMAKEIAEQPEAVSSAMRRRVDFDGGTINLQEVPFTDEQIRSIDRVVVSGMGTSLHSCMYGAQMIEALAGIPAQAENASELRYRQTALNDRTLVISVTQSGETADTLAAMEMSAESGSRQLALVEAEGTQATLVANGTLYLGAGQEIGVASTKTMMCSLAVLYQLAVYLGERRGSLSAAQVSDFVSDLSRLPGLIAEMIDDGGNAERLARERLVNKQHLMYLGRGALHPMAMEGALKMKELAYLHAEGYPAGEMKHGPIALISDEMPTVALAPQGALYDKMAGNINEVKSRGGEVIALATRGDELMPGLADEVLWLPEAPEWIVPMLSLVPLQQLAYHTSVALGHNPDKPRNLAKSVTVE